MLSPFKLIFFFFFVVSVGFEYESCPDLILWEKRTAVLQGYETTASKLGGWTIDKHHALNIQSGESFTKLVFKQFDTTFELSIHSLQRCLFFSKRFPSFIKALLIMNSETVCK